MRTFIILALCLLMAGCGARKTELEKTESKRKAEAVLEWLSVGVKKSTTDIKANTTDHYQAITPVDPSKPMVVTNPDGTKTEITNGKLETGTRASETTTRHQAEEAKEDSGKLTTKDEAEDKGKIKATDKKEYQGWVPLVILAVAAAIIIFFWIRNKRKSTYGQD